jgi:hypothetical protein
MRHPSLRALVTLTLALIGVGAAGITPARAADCGDGVGPCHCGDRVVVNTRLGGSDPVLRTPCPCDGLVVASGVSLELRGTLTGEQDNFCSGIFLEIGATGVAVTNGRITGFSVGVGAGDAPGAVNGGRFANLQILDSSFAGIFLTGDANVVESNVFLNSFFVGVLLAGNDNIVRLNRVEGSALLGLGVLGTGNTISRNLALRNDGDGIGVLGEPSIVEANRAAYNGSNGFVIAGTAVTVSLNIATHNALAGFLVEASDSIFDRNRSAYNVGFGIEDVGSGNEYTDNRCTGNGAGASDPPGLCR